MNVWHIMMEKKYIIFMGNIHGNLSNAIMGIEREEKWSDLWYVFKPKGYEKTLAEMDENEMEERIKSGESLQAMQEFAKWYEENN